jgi:hypothetical protein
VATVDEQCTESRKKCSPGFHDRQDLHVPQMSKVFSWSSMYAGVAAPDVEAGTARADGALGGALRTGGATTEEAKESGAADEEPKANDALVGVLRTGGASDGVAKGIGSADEAPK